MKGVCDAEKRRKRSDPIVEPTVSMRNSAPEPSGRYDPVTKTETRETLLGRVKWFGGFNKYTGRENHFGFIESKGVDVFAHRSHVLSPQDRMIEGAEVLFHCVEDRGGKFAARAVRVISTMSNDELESVFKESPLPSPDVLLTIALKRKRLAPFHEELHAAVATLNSDEPSSSLLGLFWEHFPPLTPSDRFYDLAPEEVKARVCKEHYAALRQTLSGLLTTESAPPTSIAPEDLYSGLEEQDRKIAALWAGTNDDPIVSQMLSARAAEKAVAQLYREAGATVEDVAVMQINGGGKDWITHDLSVDQTIPIDVKNSRRPINSKRFYVEHTIPRFKVNRVGSDVRIAGVLSPYLQRRYIENPSSAWFAIDDIVFLGETSRQDIDDLMRKYGSPHFEVVRGNERMFPNWVFGYPERWYHGLRDEMQRAADMCHAVPAVDWRYIFATYEMWRVIPALCAMGVALPSPLEGRLSEPQANFYRKLQRDLDDIPKVPDIFLAVLADFVEAIVDDRQDYSPVDYSVILFPNSGHFASSVSDVLSMQDRLFPLGAIDPLHLVASLVKTLNTLWQNRLETALMGFTNFRFGGLGLFQARRKEDVEWTTILAYCGGTEFQKGDDGEFVLSEAGRPIPQGKCGFSPLILGKHNTCPNCRKLVCHKCDFCSIGCRSEAFRKYSREVYSVAPSRQERRRADNSQNREAPPWELPPLEAYEDLR